MTKPYEINESNECICNKADINLYNQVRGNFI